MAVKLRLRRMGKKKQPFYRIVAIDSRAARNGRYIEKLGDYNPLLEPAIVNINEDRVLYWLQNGAIPSDTLRSFLKRKGILFKWHLIKKGVDEAVIEEEIIKWQGEQLEKHKRHEALAEQKKRESKQESPESEAPEAEEKIVTESTVSTAEKKDQVEEVKESEAAKKTTAETSTIEEKGDTKEATPEVGAGKEEESSKKDDETDKSEKVEVTDAIIEDDADNKIKDS